MCECKCASVLPLCGGKWLHPRFAMGLSEVSRPGRGAVRSVRRSSYNRRPGREHARRFDLAASRGESRVCVMHGGRAARVGAGGVSCPPQPVRTAIYTPGAAAAVAAAAVAAVAVAVAGGGRATRGRAL